MRDFLICAVVFLATAGLGYLYFTNQGGSPFSGGSGSVTEVGESGFDSAVRGADGPVLVDFAADWCPPCKTMEPRLRRLASEFEGRATILRVDVDASPGLSQRFSISAMPTFVIFKGGTEVSRVVGATSKENLAELLRAYE